MMTGPLLRHTLRPQAWLTALGVACLLPWSAKAEQPLPLDVHQFKIVEKTSGPVNYYTTVTEGATSFIRSAYHPPLKTAVVGVQFPDALQHGIRKIRWRWRALTLPNGGNECQSGKGDSAAVVYLEWKNGLRWYSLKYVWSSVGLKGAVCDGRRNPFLAQDTIILESGAPLMKWITEEIDPDAEFRKHFRDGDPQADVPALVGIGIMSDGDQTHSDSSADYADFVLLR